MSTRPDAAVRFDRVAANFAASDVHRSSPTMRRLHELLDLGAGARVCDVACGPGHLGFSFAHRGAAVVGVDPAPSMLSTLAALAIEQQVTVETVLARAESIPLPPGLFDAVVSKLAPHHFVDVAAAVGEMTRLARPGGAVAVIDLEGHPDPHVNDLLHRIEVLHDPTHVRSYTVEEWRGLLAGAGLTVKVCEHHHRESVDGVPIGRWCEIASSGAEAEAAIRDVLDAMPSAVLEALDITRDGSDYRYPVRTVLLIGRKPSGR